MVELVEREDEREGAVLEGGGIDEGGAKSKRQRDGGRKR